MQLHRCVIVFVLLAEQSEVIAEDFKRFQLGTWFDSYPLHGPGILASPILRA